MKDKKLLTKDKLKELFLGMSIIFNVLFVIIIFYPMQYSGGIYNPITNIIQLYADNSESPAELMVFNNHEIGHHVWYMKLNSSERDTFCQIWENEEVHINANAGKRCEEAFAEAYSGAWILKWNLSRLPEPEQKFMNDVVWPKI